MEDCAHSRRSFFGVRYSSSTYSTGSHNGAPFNSIVAELLWPIRTKTLLNIDAKGSEL